MTDAVAERFARFARDEAPGRSALYADWAAGVAGDPSMQRLLARIPENRRQPPVVFAVARMLGAPLAGYPRWRDFVHAHAGDLVLECSRRRLQTNEPLRLAPLLPVLSEIEGPLALLEVGASAGLCLYPDRYSYRFTGGTSPLEIDPVDGPSRVILESEVRGAMPPVRMPQVVWRAGIDLDPLDAAVPGDRAWLESLTWPGEAAREARIAAALEIVAADPPRLVAGDALDEIDAVAASAPSGATLVITTPGVLVHIPRARRTALIERIGTLPARWLTIDPPGLHQAWRSEVDAGTWPGFVVALDGEVRAAADPLGRWWEWRHGNRHPSA
jgi:hypothetical protein